MCPSSGAVYLLVRFEGNIAHVDVHGGGWNEAVTGEHAADKPDSVHPPVFPQAIGALASREPQGKTKHRVASRSVAFVGCCDTTLYGARQQFPGSRGASSFPSGYWNKLGGRPKISFAIGKPTSLCTSRVKC